jgi:hypothetical protein
MGTLSGDDVDEMLMMSALDCETLLGRAESG